jgi:hypothetical protein
MAGPWNPIERRSNENRHQYEAREILQLFDRRGRIQPPIEAFDRLGNLAGIRDDDAPRPACNVLAAAQAEDPDIA